MLRIVPRLLLSLSMALAMLAPGSGQEVEPLPVWHEAQHWWRPASTTEWRRLQVGMFVPTSVVSGVVRFDVRVTNLYQPGTHSPGRVQRLGVSFADGPRQVADLSWVPRRAVQTRAFRATLDTTGMSDGWHEVQIEALLVNGTDRHYARLIVPVETSNGNPLVDDAQSDSFQGARSMAWMVGGFMRSQPGYSGRGEPSADDQRTELLTGFGTVQANSEVPGEKLTSVWQPEWRVATGNTEVVPTFFLSFDPSATSNDLGTVQVNEWPVDSEQFSTQLFPPAGEHRVFAKVTDVGLLGTLASVLVFDVDVEGEPVPDPSPPPEPSAPGSPTEESPPNAPIPVGDTPTEDPAPSSDPPSEETPSEETPPEDGPPDSTPPDPANGKPVAVVGNPVVNGLQVSLNGNGSSDPDGDTLTYSWAFGDGQTSSAKNPSHTYGSGGTYTVSLTVSDGALTDTATKSVTVSGPPPSNNPPTAVIGNPVVNGLQVSLNGNGSSDPDGDTLTYSWAFGDGQTSSAKNPSHTLWIRWHIYSEPDGERRVVTFWSAWEGQIDRYGNEERDGERTAAIEQLANRGDWSSGGQWAPGLAEWEWLERSGWRHVDLQLGLWGRPDQFGQESVAHLWIRWHIYSEPDGERRGVDRYGNEERDGERTGAIEQSADGGDWQSGG